MQKLVDRDAWLALLASTLAFGGFFAAWLVVLDGNLPSLPVLLGDEPKAQQQAWTLVWLL